MVEAAGIPSFVMTRSGFVDVVKNAFAGLGFSFEAPTYVFPAETFLADSDLSPISENIDKVVYGLTKWEPEIKELGIITPPKVTVTGKNYEEAIANLNELFLNKLWGDGLPLLPPTEEQVEWMVTGTDLPRDTLIAKVLPASGLATVESIAVNAVMAGCRPEYMPVLIAAVEAVTDPAFMLQSVQATTSPISPLLIVNGPIRKQLDINSRSGLLGPGWKANATIGRAFRLILINIGGAFPGIGDMATQGHPGKYTMCIAENEEAYPPDLPGWQPLHVEMGFDRDTSTVTVVGAVSIVKSGYGGLPAMAETMKVATQVPGPEGVGTMLCIFCPEDLETYVLPGVDITVPVPVKVEPALTKEDAKKYLYENSKIPWEGIIGEHGVESSKRGHFDPGGAKEALMRQYQGKMMPQVASPDNIVIILGGGPGLHSVLIPSWGSSAMVTREVKLPANWDELLERAAPHVRPPL